MTVQQMCAEMATGDLAMARRHALLMNDHGYTVRVVLERWIFLGPDPGNL